MDSYYERYWGKHLGYKGISSSPPIWQQADLNRIKTVFEPFAQGRGLDIGCGDGFFTESLSRFRQVKEVMGVDLAKSAIGLAKQRHPEIKFGVASATQLPFRDDSFDFITGVELVEHVLDTEQLFKEFNRVLKKGGKLLITTTDFNFLKKLIVAVRFWDRYFYPTNPHIRFYSQSSLKEILNEFGFKVLKYCWHGSYFGLMPKGQIMIAQKVK